MVWEAEAAAGADAGRVLGAQNLLVMKLREQEAESQGIVEYGVNEVAGMTQHDLLTWYFDFQAERCGTSTVMTGETLSYLFCVPGSPVVF